MANLIIKADVADDLRVIKESGEVSAADAVRKIAALLREASQNSDLADEFLQFGDHTNNATNLDFNVDAFVELQKQGYDIYRIKILDLERVGLKYRVLCGYFKKRRTIVALAVAPRSFKYDTGHPITVRVIDSYRKLCADGWD